MMDDWFSRLCPPAKNTLLGMQNGLAVSANLIAATKLRCSGFAKVRFETLRGINNFRRFWVLQTSRLETLKLRIFTEPAVCPCYDIEYGRGNEPGAFYK